MDTLKDKIKERIESLREDGHKFLEGDISIFDFKKISGGMGVYAQKNKDGFMVRLRIPSGITSIEQLRWISNKASEYGLEKIHLTTRQAIQYHDLSIDEVCNIMNEALENNIYTIGSGGNFPRNVAISPLAGVDKLEAFDVTPYAIMVNNYFLKNIFSYKLPRKIKVAFSSSNMDTAHANITDLGFIAVMHDNQKYFKLYIGGGIGANSRLGVLYPELVKPEDVLYHVETILKIFVEHGDYQNRNKARIRYIVDRMGNDEFIKLYIKTLDLIKDKDLKVHLNQGEIEKEGKKTEVKHNRLFEQKQEGLYSVYFHPLGGQLYLNDLNDILDLVDDMKDIEIRLSMTEGMYIRNLTGDEAEKVLNLTQNRGGEMHLECSISCVGAPKCQIGMCNSQKLVSGVIEYFREKEFKEDVLPRIHVSGCMNSCSIHEAVLIGFAGTRKRIDGVLKDAFELHVNGSFEDGNARLGRVCGAIAEDDVKLFLYDLANSLKEKNINFNTYLEKYDDEFNQILEKYIIE